MRLSALKLQWQLVIPVGLVISVALAFGVWQSTDQLTETDRGYAELILKGGKGTVLLSRTNTALMEANAIAQRIAGEPDSAVRTKLVPEFEAALKLSADRISQARQLLPGLTEGQKAEDLVGVAKERAADLFKALASGASGQALSQARKSYEDAIAQARLTIRGLLDASTKSWDDATTRMSESVRGSITSACCSRCWRRPVLSLSSGT